MIDPCPNDAETQRISAAIEVAERNTAGEIFVVVAREADDYLLIPVMWAALAALTLVWPLFLFTELPMATVLAVQAAIFACWCLALMPEAIRFRVVPGPFKEAQVERAARGQFMSHGIHLTEARTGVLIFVALAERRVEIVADDGIAQRVGQDEWDAIADTVTVAARGKALSDGLVRAVEQAGALLARHFPPAAINRDELPNRVVEL